MLEPSPLTERSNDMRARLFVLAAALAAVLAIVAAAGASRHVAGVGRLAFALKDATGVSSIYSVRPDGSGLVRLTTGPSTDLCPDYSRDGRQIAFCSNRSGEFQIWTMNADGTGLHQVTSGAGASFTFPDFSPDRRRIVFAGTATAAASSDDVYAIGADGTGLAQLTSGPGNNDYPAYSPAGRQIVFISDRTGTEQVWVMNADGSHQTQLTHSGVSDDEVPDWSPDGRRIVYQEGDPPNGRIWVMNADGTGNHRLTSGPGNDFGPAWSPDGRQLAFVRDLGGGDRSVWVMDADGSNAHRLLPIPLTEYVPAWGMAH
jgi:Tol biopolymer transport system component